MARFLITAEGMNATRDGARLKEAVKASKAKAKVKITNIKQDEVFDRSCLIRVSCDTKAGATKVQKICWDEFGAGCVEIAKLPDRGNGGHRMGAAIPVSSYYD